MAFENVLVRLTNGQQHGPIPWETLRLWVQQNRVPADAMLVCQTTQAERTVASFPDLAALPRSDDAAATIIPYRNMPALVGYYLGVFSLTACIPILGIVGIGMGIAAVVLGFKGLRNVERQPCGQGHRARLDRDRRRNDLHADGAGDQRNDDCRVRHRSIAALGPGGLPLQVCQDGKVFAAIAAEFFRSPTGVASLVYFCEAPQGPHQGRGNGAVSFVIGLADLVTTLACLACHAVAHASHRGAGGPATA